MITINGCDLPKLPKKMDAAIHLLVTYLSNCVLLETSAELLMPGAIAGEPTVCDKRFLTNVIADHTIMREALLKCDSDAAAEALGRISLRDGVVECHETTSEEPPCPER